MSIAEIDAAVRPLMFDDVFSALIFLSAGRAGGAAVVVFHAPWCPKSRGTVRRRALPVLVGLGFLSSAIGSEERYVMHKPRIFVPAAWQKMKEL